MVARQTLLAIAAITAATKAEARDNPEMWLTLGADGEIAPRVQVELESVVRAGDDQGGIYEVEGGFLIGYNPSDRISVTAGYVRVGQYRSGRVTAVENRFRQQLVVRFGDIAGGATDLRLRLEQRDRNDGDDLGWRLRTRLAWTRPLRENGPAVRITHESFVELNDTDWGQDAGYRRSRTFAGFRIPLSEDLDAEVGYLNQYDLEGDEEDEIAHSLALQLNLEF